MSPGLIRNEDVAYVRENVRIDEVIGDYVSLKQAGGDQDGQHGGNDQQINHFYLASIVTRPGSSGQPEQRAGPSIRSDHR